MQEIYSFYSVHMKYMEQAAIYIIWLSFYPQNNLKILDLSYKTDLEF